MIASVLRACGQPIRLLTLCGALLLGIPARAVPAVAPAADDLLPRILLLESEGRARPLESANALEQMLADTPEFSPQRLELLTVQGLMLALTAHKPAAEGSASRLEAWGRTPGAALAPAAMAAAVLVRARAMARDGSLQRAEAMLRDPPALPPAGTSARAGFRFALARASIATELGQLEEAVRLGHSALALADQTPEVWRQSEARIALTTAYASARQLERAKAFALDALARSEKAQDWVSLGRAYTSLGIVLDSLGDQQGERRSFEKALEYARRAGSKTEEARVLANLADFLLKTGDFKGALASSERALPLARELDEPNTQMVALTNIGLSHISLQRVELGKRYVREAIAIDERRGSITNVSDSLNELGGYLEKAGDMAGAAAAYHQHRKLAAGLLRDDQQRAILAIQEQYDAEGRNRALALLTRESEIKAEQIRRGDLQQRLWWLLAAAFVLSFAVVTLLVLRVRQTNRQLATSNDMLKVQSERDPLTGLANRRHFQAVMRRMAQDGKLNGTVYLLDIDHFKNINDCHGHSAGDAVLVEVARRLREVLREPDLIVRWGGEEFLVVVHGLAPDLVDTLAQRMLNALDAVPVLVHAAGATGGEPQRIAVTGSIGFATFPIGPGALRVSWERAINLVDTAMYLAKAQGRNRAYGVRLLRACDESALERITRALEGALADGEVALTSLQGRTPVAVAT